MNERIRELYYECQDESQSTESCYEKFAELIIEECAKISESVTPRHTECGNKIAAKIRQFNGADCVDSTLRNRSTYFGNNP